MPDFLLSPRGHVITVVTDVGWGDVRLTKKLLPAITTLPDDDARCLIRLIAGSKLEGALLGWCGAFFIGHEQPDYRQVGSITRRCSPVLQYCERMRGHYALLLQI